MKSRLARVLLLVTALVLASAGTAGAAPEGPESPSNCTFENGTTTCGTVGAPVVTSTTTVPSDPWSGCTTTTVKTATTTSFLSHRGTYNSQGKAVAGPSDSVVDHEPTVTEDCPVGSGRIALEDVGEYQNCGIVPDGPSIGTVYYHRTGVGNAIDVHVEVTNFGVEGDGFYAGAQCIQFLEFNFLEAGGNASADGTFYALPGRSVQFDFHNLASNRYAVTDFVTV